jgi:methionyl-tRNA formyltransferase
MGTPEFAVPSLEILLEHGFNIVAVITAVDKYGGRGKKKLLESAVKKCALNHGIDILQPKNLKNLEFIDKLKSYAADLQIVVAFRMLPEVVWNMPSLGSYNLHGSLLPKYRGAAPINWAVINGDKETGVTTFKLKHAIDTGDVLLQKKMAIYNDDTAGNVHDRMMWLGASAVLDTVQRIHAGKTQLLQQDSSETSKAPKIHRETCEIDFDKECEDVYNFIRGMSPYPTAWTKLNGQQLKIYQSDFELVIDEFKIGEMQTDQKKFLKFKCKNGYVNALEVQLEGKQKMGIQSFLNGYKFTDRK